MSPEDRAVLEAEAHVRGAACQARIDAGKAQGVVAVPRALLSRVCDLLEDFELGGEDAADSDALYSLLVGSARAA